MKLKRVVLWIIVVTSCVAGVTIAAFDWLQTPRRKLHQPTDLAAYIAKHYPADDVDLWLGAVAQGHRALLVDDTSIASLTGSDNPEIASFAGAFQQHIATQDEIEAFASKLDPEALKGIEQVFVALDRREELVSTAEAPDLRTSLKQHADDGIRQAYVTAISHVLSGNSRELRPEFADYLTRRAALNVLLASAQRQFARGYDELVDEAYAKCIQLCQAGLKQVNGLKVEGFAQEFGKLQDVAEQEKAWQDIQRIFEEQAMPSPGDTSLRTGDGYFVMWKNGDLSNSIQTILNNDARRLAVLDRLSAFRQRYEDSRHRKECDFQITYLQLPDLLPSDQILCLHRFVEDYPASDEAKVCRSTATNRLASLFESGIACRQPSGVQQVKFLRNRSLRDGHFREHPHDKLFVEVQGQPAGSEPKDCEFYEGAVDEKGDKVVRLLFHNAFSGPPEYVDEHKDAVSFNAERKTARASIESWEVDALNAFRTKCESLGPAYKSQREAVDSLVTVVKACPQFRLVPPALDGEGGIVPDGMARRRGRIAPERADWMATDYR